MSVENVRQLIGTGNEFIQGAPVEEAEDRIRSLDATLAVLAVAKAAEVLAEIGGRFNAAASGAQAVHNKAELARSHYEYASAGSENAEAVDMVGAAAALSSYSKEALDHVRGLKGELSGIMLILESVRGRLGRYDARYRKAVGAAELASEVQSTIVPHAEAYLQNIKE